MSDIFRELAAALRERVEIISDEESRRDEAAHMTRLQAVSEKIEQLEKAMPTSTDPQLRHYLQRRSYSKALEFLNDPTAIVEPPRGSTPKRAT